ncbi:MAG: hypothetical protein HOQ24_18410 [Mycobacteriaceae bacterium]|nr:hypothetical protein [Mycobacteriaceae bacterium]
MANPSYSTPGAMPPAYNQPGPPEPPRNARGETPAETERRWLGNIASVVLPMFLARKLLKPKYRTGHPDPVMERMVRIRAWLGLAVVFGVFLRVFYENKVKKGGPSIPGMENVPTNIPTDFGTGFPTGFGTNTNLGAPGPGATGAPSADALANVPMPRATGLPTDFSTAFNLPTLPTGTKFPSFTAVPGNVPTPAPSGNGSGLPSGMGQQMQDLQNAMSAVDKVNDGFAVFQEIAASVIERVILAPISCMIGIVLIGMFLVLSARPHAREHTLRQLVHPIRVILLFAAITAASVGAYVGLHRAAGLNHKTYPINKDGTTLQLVLSWAAAFVLLWALMFALGALWQVTRHLFAAIDGHPLLPALLAMWLAWSLTLNDLSLKAGSQLVPGGQFMDSQDTVPDNVKAAVAILGSTAITALALWEIARINKWNGIDFRSGPFGHRP